MTALAVAALGVVGASGPAHASWQSSQAWINVTFKISATFNIGGNDSQTLRAIEAARQEILAEVAASEQRILQHIDNTEAAHVAACVRTASQDLRNIDRYRERAERTAVARAITDCANLAGEVAKAVQTLPVIDYLGYAIAEVNAIAAVFRASTGLDRQSQLVNYISDYEALVPRLTIPTDLYPPSRAGDRRCWFASDGPRPGIYNTVYTCKLYGEHTASYTEQYYHEPCAYDPQPCGDSPILLNAPVDLEALGRQAAASTSRRVAEDALPGLRQALAKVRRGFQVMAVPPAVVTDQGVVRSGQARYWSADGPLNWARLGNSGTATAITAALDPGNRRHVFAVIDGGIWWWARLADGSWTGGAPWGGPASAVSAASNQQGQIHLTAVIGGQLHHRLRVSDAGWTEWGLVGNPGTATAVTSAVDAFGNLRVFAIIDGTLWHVVRFTDGRWASSSWGVRATAVTAAAQPGGHLHLAAVVDGQLQHRIDANWEAWTDFAPVGGLPAGSSVRALASAVDPAGDYQLAAVVAVSGLQDVQLRTRFPNGFWSAEWARLGVPEDVFLEITGIAAS